MFGLISPWLLLAALLTILGAFTGGYVKGRSDANSNCSEARMLILEAAQAAQKAAAQEIAKIEIRHTTIRQKVQREVLEKPVYRTCNHSPDGLRLVNQALSNGANGADDLKLSRDAWGASR